MSSLLENAKLFELSPEQVDEGQRIGFLHEDKAAAIGRLMAVDGQRDPIKVVANPKNKTRPWKLVTGMHRLIGARLEGILVHAIEVSGKPEDLADLEASENLHRRPLAPIERAKFVAALCRAAQERLARQHGSLKQQQLGAAARWAKVKTGEMRVDDALEEESDDAADKMSAAYGWQESAADALGMDKRTIRRSLELSHLLIEPFPDLILALAQHPVIGENASQLKLIAGVKIESQRRDVIAMLLADPEMGAEQALAQVGVGKASSSAPVAPHQKFFDQIVGGWGRLGLPQQREFVPTIADLVHTPEMKRSLRDRLNEQLGETGLKPAVPLQRSVKPDYLVCLEDGTRHLNLTAHIARLGMTRVEYRKRWKLPADYPFVAPNHAERRRKHWTALLLNLKEAADAQR